MKLSTLLLAALLISSAHTASAEGMLPVHWSHPDPSIVDTYDVVLGTTRLGAEIGRYTLVAPSSEADGTFRAEVQLTEPLPPVTVYLHMTAKGDEVSQPSNVHVIPAPPVVLGNSAALWTIFIVRLRTSRARA